MSYFDGVLEVGKASLEFKVQPVLKEKKAFISAHICGHKIDNKLNLALTQSTPSSRKAHCSNCKKDVELSELRSLVNYKGQDILLTKEDKDSLKSKEEKHIINVLSYHDSQAIDPIYYQSSFILEPTTNAMFYFALVKALQESNAIILGEVTVRETKYIVVVRPFNNLLAFHQLFYADELSIPEISELEIPESISKTFKIKTQKFNINKYENPYNVKLEQLLKSKLKSFISFNMGILNINIDDLIDNIENELNKTRREKEVM